MCQRAWIFLKLLFWNIFPNCLLERFNLFTCALGIYKGLSITLYIQGLKMTSFPSAISILHVSFLRKTMQDAAYKIQL